MIINGLYTIFFGGLNWVLFLYLSQKSEIKRQYFIALGAIIIIVLILHSIGEVNFLMSGRDFFNLLLFSFALIILHFFGIFQKKIFEILQNDGIEKKEFYGISIKIYDFMRYRLIYIMIYIYQVVAIWYPQAR